MTIERYTADPDPYRNTLAHSRVEEYDADDDGMNYDCENEGDDD